MVGMMAINSREKLATLINSAKLASDIASKLDFLREFKKLLPQEDPVLLTEFLPSVFDLLSDRFSPIRKYVTEMVGEIGSKNIEFLPEIVPMLRTVLDDSTPAVSRQAISLGTKLFRLTLEKIAIQGLYSSELDSTLESAWAWMLNFKEKVYTIAFQPGSSGTRLLALKFVEAVICLYTPHPNGLSEPPSHDGSPVEFSISWLRRGHPVLNIRDLSVEASQNLGILLDLLRFPAVKSLSNSMIIVLINSLSKIANERPAFYGRILPVLLGLEPSSSIVNSVQIFPAHCALRKAFLTCLKCTHPSAAPWRERLSDALKEIESGKFMDKVLYHPEINNGVIMKTEEDEDEKPMMGGEDILDSNIGRKRSKPENGNDLAEGEDAPGKKVRPMAAVSEGSNQVLNVNVTVPQERDTCNAAVPVKADVDNGPAQQLVGMFGALLAQGEKAVGSLEILISSISADLLAEVVIATMRNLPPNHPSDDNNDELLHNMSIIGSDENARYPPSFIAGVMSLSSTFPPVASLLDAHQSLSSEVEKSQGDDETSEMGVDTVSNFNSDHTFANQTEPVDLPSSAAPVTAAENGISTVPSDTHDVGNLESEIPGLDSYVHNDRLSDTVATSSLVSTDVEDASQEQLTNVVQRSLSNLVPSLSTDKSEELSPKAAVTDASSLVSSTATSIQLPPRLVLPKMMAPVVDLPDEQKDNLQKLAFSRIVDAYKQIAVAGGTQVYISLLPSLAIEYPLELDPWKLLQKHILADYASYEGQELTLRVLYRLYGEAEEDSDFFSSTTAASVYETFLLTVTEALKDSFPPSDKSLSRLLGDAPYLPKSVLKILESMCSPENHDTGDKESQGGDRVTQGLSSVWGLILQRPPFRDACLKIALQSAVHCLEEVRMKAIRLVANKLYPLSYLAQQIEDFAKEMLFSIINSDGSELMDAEASSNEPKKEPDEDKPSNEQLYVTGSAKDVSPDAHQSSTSPSASVQPLSEAQRCLSLYFALCTKKHSLFRQIFVIYRSASKAVKQAIHRHIPILVRTMGPSSDLLEIISDPPSGSDNLLMQVLHTLTDGTVPSKDLILTVRKLYDSKGKDAEVLLPVLPFLSKEEVMLAFPRIVSLPPDKFQAALARTLQGSTQGGPVLTPAEVLIAIHGIDPERDGIPLKKVTDACNVCFEQRQTFTQQVLAKVLNQLVEQIPLPLLFMRTVLQAIGAFPALVDFIMEILSRLVSKQIWKYPKLWVGFLKCAQLTKPQSFSVLLQLPPAQLENALNRIPALKAPLVAHATQSTVQPSLPRSLLVVLGIVPDSQALSQAQASQASTAQTSQVSQGQTCQTSQSQTSQTSQGQTSQAQTSDTHDSDKEASAEKSKESSNASRSAISGS